MLEPGTHLECQILHKNKYVVFMSNILDSNETELLIKPPKVKSRPANMKQFTELSARFVVKTMQIMSSSSKSLDNLLGI
ncbi:MAG: hypothetical protein CM1200mP28_09400 [Deltaproteobacteria bacterium]|nr:MAG: hypothetical protein CM1200mP28_09400 [Deltaproteobacteria bacterium]